MTDFGYFFHPPKKSQRRETFIPKPWTRLRRYIYHIKRLNAYDIENEKSTPRVYVGILTN